MTGLHLNVTYKHKHIIECKICLFFIENTTKTVQFFYFLMSSGVNVLFRTTWKRRIYKKAFFSYPRDVIFCKFLLCYM